MNTSKRSHGRSGLLAALVVMTAVTLIGQGRASALTVPLLSNQASTSGAMYDSATLGNGNNPTGAITFRLYGPSDPLCLGSPVFTSATAVNGNGYYESSRYAATVAGTYRWTAVYGGDAKNAPSLTTLCADPAALVTVLKRVPVLTAAPSTVRPSAIDTAVLTMAVAPTGTIIFSLYGPDAVACLGAPVFASTSTVTGNGSYSSAAAAPTVPGRYRWIARYSGDAGNMARATSCSDANGFTVGPVVTTAVSGSPATVVRGGTIAVAWSAVASPAVGDWVGLYKVGTADGGTVVAWMLTTGTAAGTLPLKFPWGATAGSYELRLMASGTTQRLATSLPITVVS